MLLLRDRNAEGALAAFRRSAVVLLGASNGADYRLATEALSYTLAWQSEALIVAGRVAEGRRTAAEAVERLRTIPGADRGVQLYARFELACARAFEWDAPDEAVADSRRCYEAALSEEYVTMAIDFGTFLGVMYRLRSVRIHCDGRICGSGCRRTARSIRVRTARARRFGWDVPRSAQRGAGRVAAAARSAQLHP
jgi:hypothetical protein